MSAGRKKINLEINNYPPKFAGRKMGFFLLLVSDFEVLKVHICLFDFPNEELQREELKFINN